MTDTQEITLDIHNHKVYEQFYQKQYNKNTTLIFHITNDGEPFDVSGIYATFQMKKPDGTIIVDDCTITDKNTISIALTEQMTSAHGFGSFQIMMVDSKNKTVISTITARMRIDESTVHPSDTESSDELNFITNMLIEIEDIRSTVNNMSDEVISSEEPDTQKTGDIWLELVK